jgi:hypothetical protein
MTAAASATMEDLSSDLLTDFVFRYVGDKQFRFMAAVNRTFYTAYTRIYPKKRTSKHANNIHTKERLMILLNEVGRIKSLKSVKYVKDMVIHLAAKHGTLDIVALFHMRHPNITPIDTSKIFARAALHGYLDGIRQLHETLVTGTTTTTPNSSRRCPWDHFTCSNAALNGHLEILKYAYDNGCQWDAWTCSNAALNGHLDVLQLAHENGCPWTEHTCSNAALNGHLHILEYAHVHGCPWNEFTCSNAALNGHMDVLVYAFTRGCPWNSYTCSNAAQNGHLHILKYARIFNCPWTHHTVQKAMEHGHVDVARWACRNGCRGSFLFHFDDEDDPMNDNDDNNDVINFDHYLLRQYNGDDEAVRMARTILQSIMRIQNPPEQW